MTLEFKFPTNQTNLLALENTLYKIKIIYDDESADRNRELASEVLLDIVKDELEEAVRVLLLMFMQGNPLKRVKSCHFIFTAVRKPWKAGQKLKFKSNGQVLNAYPDVLEITVSTRVNPAAVFKDCVHYHVIIGNSSSTLRNSDSTHVDQDPQLKPRSPRSSPSKRKRTPTSSPKGKKKAKNNNFNNSEHLEDDEASLLKICPKEKKSTGVSSSIQDVHTSDTGESEGLQSVETELEEQQILHVRKPRYPLRNSKNENNSNIRSEQSSFPVRKCAQPEERKFMLAESPSRNLRSKRPLLQKSRLDQFIVEAEELAEEQKLQQLAQPRNSSPKTPKRNASSRQKPGRSSFSSALDVFLTPFRYFTRNKRGKV